MAKFSDLKVKLKFLLSLICVWPNDKSTRNVKILTAILSVYVLLVFIKNVINPEKESIENAFTLSNGNLIVVVFWMTVLLRRECCTNFFHFILNDANDQNSPFDIKISIEAATEVIRVLKWYAIFLPASTVAKFFLPIFEYAMNLGTNRTVVYPPAMGVPAEYFGEIPTFIIETSIRTLMLTTLVGACVLYAISSLHICSQFRILAHNIESFPMDDEKGLEVLIQRHQDLLEMSDEFKKIFAPYFFTDCAMSFINITIMLFSLVVDARMENLLLEGPLVCVGVSQLFFILFFGDRLMTDSTVVKNGIYNSDWIGKSVKIQKKLLFMILQAQEPRTLDVGNKLLIASMALFSAVSSNI